MKSERLVGYSLLIIGVSLMLYSVFSVFQVFTGRSKPLTTLPAKIGVKSKEDKVAVKGQLIPSYLQDQLPVEINLTNSLESLIDNLALQETINLTLHLFLMSFLLGFGHKLATLGVMLIRPIKVNLKTTSNNQ